MKKTIMYMFAVICIVGFLGACTNRQVGTVGGAVVGGVVGSEVTHGSTAGTIAGAVGGGYIGNQLAR